MRRRRRADDVGLTSDPLAELDERALVERASPAGPGAFDLIVERHRRPVYQLCYRFVGNHEDASDLSQDVFLRAYRGLRSFRGQSSLGDVALSDRRQRLPESGQRKAPLAS